MSRRATIGLWLAAALAASAQQVEHRRGDYWVSTSYEFGYRSVLVDGNREAYRAALNYNNGIRLFDGFLRMNSTDGHGRWVDEVVLTNFGAGGDPYQATGLRLEKNQFYRIDAGFRIVNYRNQLLALSGGGHGFNTERIFQNYDLTLFPQRRVQFVIGFDRNNQNGPALSSENIAVGRGTGSEPAFPRDRFFVFTDDLRRVNNQWRVGGNASLGGGVKLSFLQGWDFFKDDTRHTAPDHRRDDPVHGRTPFSRLGIHSDPNRRLSLNGRLAYAGGERNFVLDENIASLNPTSNVLVTRQAYVLGTGRRNQGSGDLTVAVQPAEKWAVSNTTSLHQTRLSGDSAFVELRQPPNRLDPARDEYFFSFLGIRHIANSTDVNFRPAKSVGFYGGYHYSIRRLQSREIREDISGAPVDVPLDTFENRAHSGLAGVRLRPAAPLTVLFDVEYGRADQPFTPVAEKNFHAETLRAQWKQKEWLLTGSFKAYRNRNTPPPVLTELEGAPAAGHRYESRQYGLALAWTPQRYSLDAGYTKLHLDTASGIVNFPLASGPNPAARRSLYVSDLHQVHGALRVELPRQSTLFLGYTLVKDTADVSRPSLVLGVAPSYPSFGFDGTDFLNAYPLSYQSPQVRLSFPLHKKLSWNAGWQYYKYGERYTGLQDYTAHLATTSVRWTF